MDRSQSSMYIRALREIKSHPSASEKRYRNRKLSKMPIASHFLSLSCYCHAIKCFNLAASTATEQVISVEVIFAYMPVLHLSTFNEQRFYKLAVPADCACYRWLPAPSSPTCLQEAPLAVGHVAVLHSFLAAEELERPHDAVVHLLNVLVARVLNRHSLS